MYKEFKDIEPDNNNKYVINGDNWKSFVIEKMKEHCSSYKLESYEVTSEEISKTDPNSAKVKTKINITTSNGKSELECSFPLKRENDTWFIIG